MDKEILKSKSDQRVYRTLVLDNKLECMVVSDVEAEKSSAAMSMGIGSLQDPVETQGLAHYLEHMLFMGTEKYPDQNDYANFITKNSGSNNAYTSQEETNYQLEVSSAAFPETLDRFAQFFIAPLFAESSSERELNAVHSEHSKNLQNDSWRKFQLSKHLAKEGHPYRKFSTGDKSTLSNPNLCNMLLDFYNSNYSANLMKLVIYGKEKVDVLAQWAKDMFSAIPNRDYKREKMTECPYDEKAMKKLYKIVPVKDKKTIEITWILKLQQEHYRNHPGKYVSNLLGHEGKGSLLSFLVKEGLATGLNTWYEDCYDCYSQMSVLIDLTQKGITELKAIIEYCLHYIEMLKEAGPQEWIFEELQAINKMKFQYMEKKKGMMHTARMAKYMHQRKIEELIVYPYLMEKWEPEIIKQFLSSLTLDNIVVMAQAQQFQSECNLSEPIYKTKYSEEMLKDICPRKCPVTLPEKNYFIPKDFTVLPMGTEKVPEKLYNSELVQSFYKKDHCFQLPKVSIHIRIHFEGARTVQNEVVRTLFADLMKEDFQEFVYLAQMAQIDATFKFPSFFYADITIKGFRDSIVNFVQEYLDKIFKYKPENENIFETLVEKLKRKYSNYFLEDPYRLAYEGNIRALRYGSEVCPKEKLSLASKVQFNDITYFAQKWKRKVYVEAYVAGNIEKDDALNLITKTETILKHHSEPLPSHLFGEIRAVNISQKNRINLVSETLLSEKQENSSVIVHFQDRPKDIKGDLTLKLCEAFTKEPAFDYLRTKQQLGYIVFCLSEDHRGVGGLTLLVQSAIKTTNEIISYIDKFLNEHLKDLLEKLDEKTFDEYKTAMKLTKQEKDKNLSEETMRFWGEIVKHRYDFSRKDTQIETLPTITLQQFKNTMNEVFFRNPHRFEFHIKSHRNKEQNENLQKSRQEQNNIYIFGSAEEFNRQMELYPDFYGKR